MERTIESLIKSLPEALGPETLKVIDENLLSPVQKMLERPGKKFRAELVEIGSQFGLTGPDQILDFETSLKSTSEALEALHLGSLVIDDIQDDSQMRRGQPSLHKVMGAPLAINTGNWLYFWSHHLLSRVQLGLDARLEMHRIFNETLLQAHLGQCLDLSTRPFEMSSSEWEGRAQATMRLKTGSLMSLALTAGSLLTAASPKTIKALRNFGFELGLVLQMQDDLGNVFSDRDPGKAFEDLNNGRLSYALVAIQKWASTQDQELFYEAWKSKNLSKIKTLKTPLSRALSEAQKFSTQQFENAFSQLKKSLDYSKGAQNGFASIERIGQRILDSYV